MGLLRHFITDRMPFRGICDTPIATRQNASTRWCRVTCPECREWKIRRDELLKSGMRKRKV